MLKMLFAITFILVVNFSGITKTKNLRDVVLLCNATPFEIHYTLISESPNNSASIKRQKLSNTDNFSSNINAGSCSTEVGELFFTNTKYFLYGSTRNRMSQAGFEEPNLVDYLYTRQGREVNLFYTPDDLSADYHRCFKLYKNYVHPAPYEKCPDVKDRIDLPEMPFFQIMPGQFLKGRFVYVFTTVDTDNSFLTNAKSEWELINGTAEFKKLEKAVNNRRSFDIATNGFEKISYHFGADFTDQNGYLAEGIQINNIEPYTIFSDSRNLYPGDIITAINGNTIYSVEDLFVEIHSHGDDFQRGITNPLVVSGTRANGESFIINDLYYYTSLHRFWEEDLKPKAVGYGLLNSMTLGNVATSLCLGEQVPSRLKNMLSWIAEAVDNDGKKRGRVENPDFIYCKWEASEKLAIVNQYERGVFTNAAWLTMITPNAPRLLLSKLVSKSIKSVSGLNKGVALSSVTAVGLELFESGITFANEKSPVQSSTDLIDDYISVTPYLIGITLISQILIR